MFEEYRVIKVLNLFKEVSKRYPKMIKNGSKKGQKRDKNKYNESPTIIFQ